MKHLKLFESKKYIPTVMKYDIIKKPYAEGYYNTTDTDKLNAIATALIKRGYTQHYEFDDDNEAIIWEIDMKGKGFYWMQDEPKPKTVMYNEIIFDEHFKLKHEFRGLDLKKKFGL